MGATTNKLLLNSFLARLLHVLSTVYTAVSSNTGIACTKRGLMYENTLLFPNQACSDQMLNTLANLLQCDQAQLRVVSINALVVDL